MAIQEPFKAAMSVTIGDNFRDEDEAEANALLVAAAPSMAEALVAVLKWREGPEGPEILFSEGAKMLEKVRAALAEAKIKC